MRNSMLRSRGFTLVEMLMVVAILAVLVSVAAPSYGKLFGRTQTGPARAALSTALNLARMTAAARRSTVVVCPSDDLRTCTRTTQWHHGWIVFADRDRDGTRSGDEELLSVQQALPAGAAVVSTTGRMRVTYSADGFSPGSNLTLTACSRTAGPDAAIALIVNNAGRVRSAPASAAAAATCLQAAGG